MNISETTYTPPSIDELSPKQYILIKNARVNNLKNLTVAIPRHKLVVVTGLSGSGKSSLAFDTLFAEGQRMYVESLSAYARQFLGRMEKPEVEYIKGVSPAIAIEQKVNSRNPRSTVGTSTEIYDYLKLLFARIGVTYSPVSGLPVRRDSVSDVVNYVQAMPEGTRLLILSPFVLHEGRSISDELKILLQKGFTRIAVGSEVVFIEELTPETLPKSTENIKILIDRASVKHNDEDNIFRISDSVQTAFYEGLGTCIISVPNQDERFFSDKFEADGITFEEPSINLFSFNNPYGACKTCEGFGKVMGIDHSLVFPDHTQSVYEGAIAPWRGDTMRNDWLKPLLKNGIQFDFPVHRAYEDLTEEEKNVLWTGNTYFRGLNSFFEFLESNTMKIQYRVMYARYRGKTTCPDCRGSRLRKDAAYVKIAGKSITDLVLMPIEHVRTFFETLQLTDYEHKVAKQIVTEIRNRLRYIDEVGLGYLMLGRLTNTLSGGEFQRIKLATSLGSALVGSMYILDEPSIGLHPRDTQRLIGILKTLRDLGNTVIVVEHEEEVMHAADQIIDIGPEAGSGGGHLVFQGNFRELNESANTQSYTYQYLNHLRSIATPTHRRTWYNSIKVNGASENNLQNINVALPLGVLTVITGVSGSGKSTLVKKVVYPFLAKKHGIMSEEAGRVQSVTGDVGLVPYVEFVDQHPIGKSSRSNPVTYIKAYDAIRTLFAEQPLAAARGYKPAFFSFNIDGGRCEVCQGEGEITIEMQFMADVKLKCESCKGKRFKHEILEVKVKDKDISDVLDMTIDDSLEFFADKPRIADKLRPLAEVGLGYVRLGQSSNTLSGGEAQRVKLASFLGKNSDVPNGTIFIFDEPTTGLHFHDINKLLKAMNALIDKGNTIWVIEHNTDVIKCADWIIDLGPEGGERGGKVCFEGTPEQMLALADSNHTARFLKQKMS